MTREVPITRGRVALVDDEDFERVSSLKWSLSHGYAKYGKNLPGGGRFDIYMHRFILEAAPGQLIDHINGNRLDNRRVNLRFCTQAQNSSNKPKRIGQYSSRYKGVYWMKPARAWCANIVVRRVQLYLGLFAEEQDAALAYDAAARQYHGEFASLNFPDVSTPDSQAIAAATVTAGARCAEVTHSGSLLAPDDKKAREHESWTGAKMAVVEAR